jgi:hypothetical protein
LAWLYPFFGLREKPAWVREVTGRAQRDGLFRLEAAYREMSGRKKPRFSETTGKTQANIANSRPFLLAPAADVPCSAEIVFFLGCHAAGVHVSNGILRK